MGFLKFLKREKKEEALEDLDLPPAPPPLDGFDDKTPEMPEFPEFDEKISAPDNFPKFNFPEKEEEISQSDENKSALFPSFPEMEESMSPIEPVRVTPSPALQPLLSIKPMPQYEENVPQQESKPMHDEDSKTGRGLFRHEKSMLREISGRKEIYVRVDKFKAMLQSISIMRSNLRKSGEALMKLENIKNSKDRSYDKIKSSIDDLQNKLIFVDKTLFKGD